MNKSNVFLTSDTHFNHNNILSYCPESRGHFSSIEDMNETLIDQWNLTVPPDATVYHLGDLCMGRVDTIEPILKRLNGHIILIRGNHDYGKRRKEYEKCGVEIKDIDYISYKGKYFVLSHIPIGNPEYMELLIGNNTEVWNLHGHTHQTTNFGEVPHCYHVGVDSHNMMPVNLDNIYWDIRLREELDTTFGE